MSLPTAKTVGDGINSAIKFVDDCEFEISYSDATKTWSVSCWNGEGYQNCHWYLEYRVEADAVKEFNRWTIK